MNILNVYQDLLTTYGPQNWWPCLREEATETYHPTFDVLVGTILTQNTAWTNVEPALQNLHAQGMLTARQIYRGRTKIIEEQIRSSGYYRQKAKKLKLLSEHFIRHYQGDVEAFWMEGDDLMKKRAELLSIWGVGRETADSMLLYGYHQPMFVIDTYTKRLCKEQGVEFKDYDEYRQFFEAALPKDSKMYNEFHALIVAWGKE